MTDTTRLERTKPCRAISELGQFVLVDRFESGKLYAADWNHRTQLAVSAWYLIHFDEPEATERMIDGIRRTNRTQCSRLTLSDVYHETLTLFWLAMARHFLSNHPSSRLLARVNELLREYGHCPDLYLEYYSPDLVMSWRARNSWVAPDLKPIPSDTPRHSESLPTVRDLWTPAATASPVSALASVSAGRRVTTTTSGPSAGFDRQ